MLNDPFLTEEALQSSPGAMPATDLYRDEEERGGQEGRAYSLVSKRSVDKA